MSDSKEHDVVHNSEGQPNDSSNNKASSFFSRFKKGNNDSDAKTPDEAPKVKFLDLFRYTTRKEKVYSALAVICAIIHGSMLPMFTIIFGGLVDSFSPNTPLDDVLDEVGGQAKWFLILAAGAFVTSLIQVRFQLVVAQGLCARIRQKYFESLMSQDFSWYNVNDGGELTTRVANDVNVIQAGVGDKVTAAVQFVATFFVGIIIAFVYGPLLTLVVLSLAPLLMGGGAVFGKLAADSTGDGLGAYGTAGAIASESIGLIRVVSAYNGQQSEIKRYSDELDSAYRANVKKAIIGGFALGFTMFIIFCSYAIAFTFGAWQKRNGDISTGDILTTFFAVIIACVSLGQAAPSFAAFAAAQGAAPRIFDVIERQSEINPLDEEHGDVIKDFKGHISFKNVDFAYSKKSEVGDAEEPSETSSDDQALVLSDFSMDAPPGTSHALVGPSGCGKSTTVRLIERFYDVRSGVVKLDGVDIRTLNVRWLRSQIGYVGQMPTLFMRSIRDNIALGAPLDVSTDELGKQVVSRRTVTDDEIVEAAKMANAHDFIMKLPEQYDTELGERGALLSGGQKQRICIARALIRNPKILILDESTAALDSNSERVVQEALESAAAGRTTITIAHRLSTVRNADVISVLKGGKVVESASHDELVRIEDGIYRKLVEHQTIEAAKAEDIRKAEPKAGEDGGEAKVLTDSVTQTKTGRGGKGEEKDKEEVPDVDKGVLLRAFQMNAGEWFYILFGVVGAAMAGASFPISAVLFSEAINAILSNAEWNDIRQYAFYYLAVGAGAFIGNLFHLSLLGISGERLTRKLRLLSFKAIMRQDMGFFDEKENALGAITTRLATDASSVQGVTGSTLGGLSFGISTIVSGFLVSYLACWRVALVVTGMFPLMAVAGALQVKMMTGFDSDSDKKYMAAGAIASEAVDNYETVTATGVQDVFIDKYNEELQIPVRNGLKTSLIAGVTFGLSEFLSFALWAVSFWVGAIFVRNGQCDFEGLMKAITGLLFAGMMLGQIATYLPDVSKSKVSATKVFRLLDRETRIDPTAESGSHDSISGNVDLDKVVFEYPTRPDVAVLRGLSVGVGKGKTLALVGASGCGKSTVVSLLERFYDPRSGTVGVDSKALPEYNLGWLRKNAGLVSQEPDLFNRSIRDNIAYGLDHEDGTVVTDEIIERAAKAANVHTFATELSEGYDTVVGPRGGKLSGGQRQRVAIARAIVREPKLLLLDEATSALDATSERLVQKALDAAAEGRTTVAIAHRLSTVRDADAIAVVGRGKIVEMGTHDQLLRIENGEYATLVQNQLTGADDVDVDGA